MKRDTELLATARAIARLQAKARRLRRELKQVAAELRHERKMLRGLVARMDTPDIAPSRVFGAGVGVGRLHQEDK